MNRLEKISSHLQSSNGELSMLEMRKCIGEMENRQEDSSGKLYTRITMKVAYIDSTIADERYGGSADMAFIEGELLLPKTESKTCFIFMHPSGMQNLLPMPMAMARSGLHVVTCLSRYPNNDSCLIMEKVLVDLSECIKAVKKRFGYEKVVLCGWSGGGSLSSFYQAQAEKPVDQRIKLTPAGDPVNLSGLVPADGLLILAAHISRAKIFTEWIDPAVLDERDPSIRDVELDLWNPKNPNKPPFTEEYVKRFRQAQIQRNRKITEWVFGKLRELETQYSDTTSYKQKIRDFPFVVHCTQADIRRVDTNLEPNGRTPTPLSALAAENHSPVGLSRFTTCRSWLSQFSYDMSNADGPKSLAQVKCPVLVMENGADHLVPNVHPQQMFKAVSHTRKKYLLIKGATHYYFDQKDLMQHAISEIKLFLKEQQLLI